MSAGRVAWMELDVLVVGTGGWRRVKRVAESVPVWWSVRDAFSPPLMISGRMGPCGSCRVQGWRCHSTTPTTPSSPPSLTTLPAPKLKMSSNNQPPWRSRPPTGANRNPNPTIPRKRAADTQEEAWVADEDRFVLQQAKRKAAIRVKNGRAKPIDWLAVTLRVIDGTNDPNEDEDENDLEIVDPEGILESLDAGQIEELEKDIDTYLALETDRKNREFWNVSAELVDSSQLADVPQTLKVICKDKRQKAKSGGREARGVSSVSADVDRLLGPKSLEELETLEKQIRKKLDSDESIDVDYWEHLLRSLLVWKAKARLRLLSQTIVDSRLQNLRKQQEQEATNVREKLMVLLGQRGTSNAPTYSSSFDPDPLLKLRPEDKHLECKEEKPFLESIVSTIAAHSLIR